MILEYNIDTFMATSSARFEESSPNLSEFSTTENDLSYQNRFYEPLTNYYNDMRYVGEFLRREYLRQCLKLQLQKAKAINRKVKRAIRLGSFKGTQRNNSDSNLLKARKARNVPIEIELERKRQLNCTIKAHTVAEKYEIERLNKQVHCLEGQLHQIEEQVERKDEIIKKLLEEQSACITVSKFSVHSFFLLILNILSRKF